MILLLVYYSRLLIRGTDQCRISLELCIPLVVMAFLSDGVSAPSSLSSNCFSCSFLLYGFKVEATHVARTGVFWVNKTFKFVDGEEGLNDLVVRNWSILHA